MSNDDPAFKSNVKPDTKISSADDLTKQGDIALTERELGKVSGGKTPQPGGPVPIPYPNVAKT